MRCILMNKNTKVLEAEYNKKIASFTNIYNIENIDYAPIIIKNALKENNNNTFEYERILVGGDKLESKKL